MLTQATAYLCLMHIRDPSIIEGPFIIIILKKVIKTSLLQKRVVCVGCFILTSDILQVWITLCGSKLWIWFIRTIIIQPCEIEMLITSNVLLCTAALFA